MVRSKKSRIYLENGIGYLRQRTAQQRQAGRLEWAGECGVRGQKATARHPGLEVLGREVNWVHPARASQPQLEKRDICKHQPRVSQTHSATAPSRRPFGKRKTWGWRWTVVKK